MRIGKSGRKLSQLKVCPGIEARNIIKVLNVEVQYKTMQHLKSRSKSKILKTTDLIVIHPSNNQTII